MSEPRIDKNLRIGRFLLDDILRSFGGYQWFLFNISKSQMSEPLLGEIMSCLMHVGAADLTVCRNGSVCYMQREEHPGIYRRYISSLLTRNEADNLIDAVCAKAASLNEDLSQEFSYRRIFLFGSCLTDKTHPGDVDLGVEIHFRDGSEVPETSYYPFRSPESFDIAAAKLCPRGSRKKLSLHHHRELANIQAPNQLIWTKDSGRIKGPLSTPVRSPENEKIENQTNEMTKKAQALMDAFSDRVKNVKNWPEPPSLEIELKHVRDLTRKEWIEFQNDQLVLAFGHLLSLPEGQLRDKLAEELSKLKLTEQEIKSVKSQAAAYVKAGIHFNPWTLRTNGRLLKRGSDL